MVATASKNKLAVMESTAASKPTTATAAGKALRAPPMPPYEEASRNNGSAMLPAPANQSDGRVQPWQSLMAEIERESNLSPPGSDYFPCQQGFHAHSLAG